MNALVHFEIHASDLEKAAEFYRQVFGWEIKKWDGPVDYWLITTREEGKPGINGGLVKRRGETPQEGAAVNAYVCTMEVPNVDEVVARVQSAGGSIALPKMPVPGVGWLAYAKDLEGNIFGIMQSDPEAK